MTVARADRAGMRPRTCCPTHADACRFGRDHTWAGPYLLDAGRPVNGAGLLNGTEAPTEAVSGYTSHGHRITGVVQTGRPASVARCGGPGLCTVCSLEAGMATNERHGQ